MKKNIILLVPNRDMLVLSQSLLNHYENVEVKVGLLEHGVEIAQALEKESEIAVFIARGGTALLLRQAGIIAPLIEIPVTVYDLIRSVDAAKKFATKIAMVGFSSMIKSSSDLAPILGVELGIFYLDEEGTVDGLRQLTEQRIKHVNNLGFEAIIGGVITCTTASRFGIPSILIKTGKEAILKVVEEAQRVAFAAKQEKAKMKQLKAILEFAHEGVITTDSKGIITVINPAAEKKIGKSRTKIKGKPINKFMPSTVVDRVLNRGEMVLGELQTFNKAQVVTNNVPIIIDERVQGAVSTFQDIAEIQESEQNIRCQLRSRTHTAKFTLKDIIGVSDYLLEAKEMAQQFAFVDSTLLITGETGSGKELFAQAVHNHGNRKQAPFVAINCAALPETLLESELFGYEDGAFTGAKAGGKPGLFFTADRGTIFLDEISEIPLPLQGKLLRVLQEKEIRPIGGEQVLPIDVRVIAATNRDLRMLVQEGLFRKDLFFRINVLNLHIMPLRKRRKDIPVLVNHFIEKEGLSTPKKCRVTTEAMDMLSDYGWPGNVRELKNIIQRVILLGENDGHRITRSVVQEAIADVLLCRETETKPYAGGERLTVQGSLREMEQQIIFKVLQMENGNQSKAARRLDISRTRVWRLLKEAEEV
ncbi:MAG TPA: sigma 54-interacting transcriptional regulator [bacterium]|nr:sigma 54-interacting transcriptional regulator [bacterium]